MPKYDVLNRFKHPETGAYVDPPGPAELSQHDGQRLTDAGCLREAKAAVKKKASKKKASRSGADG